MKYLLIVLCIASLACSDKESFDNSSLPAPLQTESTEKSSVVKITKVIDGDTMDVRFKDGSTDRVRLLGVDTPETNAKNKPNEYEDITDLKCLTRWGDKSDDYAKKVLDGMLHIYEATSRFKNLDAFTSDLRSLGYSQISIEEEGVFTHIVARKDVLDPSRPVERIRGLGR